MTEILTVYALTFLKSKKNGRSFRHLGWFQFLDLIRFRNDSTTVSKMIIDSCLFATNVANRTLRLLISNYNMVNCLGTQIRK